MGKDRTSTIQLKNDFAIHTDKDHKGRFRGKQAILVQNGKHKYRGWHYHVEHPLINQKTIFTLLEHYLIHELKAFKRMMVDSNNELGIGIVEYEPESLAVYETNGTTTKKTTVLWISSFNGKLHIETNKIETYAKGILNKESLIILFNKVILSSYCMCNNCNIDLFTFDLSNEIYFCPQCDYAIDESSINDHYLALVNGGGS